MDPGQYNQGYFPFIEYDYFQGRAQCTVCGRLLVFVPGSALVQCSHCSSVLSLRVFGARGQVLCPGCQQMILFPLGCVTIQCSFCETRIELPRQRYYSCEGCGLYVTYSNGPATRVMCIVCNTLRDAREDDTEERAWKETGKGLPSSEAGPSGVGVGREAIAAVEASEEDVDEENRAGEAEVAAAHGEGRPPGPSGEAARTSEQMELAEGPTEAIPEKTQEDPGIAAVEESTGDSSPLSADDSGQGPVQSGTEEIEQSLEQTQMEDQGSQNEDKP
uniref:Zinc finger LSD1-type domain-containing protein n=2 Tax=Rhodosorus marinus TaxID=101924 RepID=A0A7S3EHX3_9RHOD|mmetsp:Transcript_37604/g.149995  ORF Transcript_37604/g.149995 Transcript_37604/m.149995 type:complete len:275 (+) Transcript_37604:634-1458(+)